MNYQFNNLSQYPYEIHNEFSFVLEDVMNNSVNPSRPRSKPAWREVYDQMYKDYSKEPESKKHFVNSKFKLLIHHFLNTFYKFYSLTFSRIRNILQPKFNS